MPNLRPTENCQENYLPSAPLRRFWRYTWKSPYNAAGVHCPGLIDYNKNLIPLVFFIIALGLEIFGLKILTDLEMSGIFAASLFMADLLFAIIQHLPVGSICDKRNLRVFAPNDIFKRNLTRQIRWLQIMRVFLSLPIVAIALLKVILFIARVDEKYEDYYTYIILSYLIVAIIHALQTGYFIAWAVVKIGDLQHKTYRRLLDIWEMNNPVVFPPPLQNINGEIAAYNVHNFTCCAYPGILSNSVNRHVLIIQNNNQVFNNLLPGPVPPNPAPCHATNLQILDGLPRDNPHGLLNVPYTLKTWGIMTDQEVQILAGALPGGPGSQGLIKEIIKHQTVNIMNIQEPWPAAVNPPCR